MRQSEKQMKVAVMNREPKSDATDEVRVAISSPRSWASVSGAMVVKCYGVAKRVW